MAETTIRQAVPEPARTAWGRRFRLVRRFLDPRSARPLNDDPQEGNELVEQRDGGRIVSGVVDVVNTSVADPMLDRALSRHRRGAS